MRLAAVPTESVACRSIPRKDGSGADGCGKGWTQEAGATRSCPTCGRALSLTDRFAVADLRRVVT